MRLAIIGFVAVGVVGFAVYDYYDKRTNFVPVNARINTVNEQCYMEKVERGVMTKSTSTSALTGCAVAYLLTQQHPKWQGYTVKHKIEIQFVFTSPVDGAVHTSSLQMSAFPNSQPLHAGDVFLVLASKSKPDKTRQA